MTLHTETSPNGIALIAAADTKMEASEQVPQIGYDQKWTLSVATGSHVMLFEEHIRNAEIIVEEGAQLDLVSVQSTAHENDETVSKHITIADNAAVRVFTALFDTADVAVNAEITGNHAAFGHQVIYMGAAKQRIRLRTNSKHVGQHTQSRTMIRGVALENSHIDFAGSIDIAQTGDATDGLLEHEGLLLSRQARIDSLPGFNINTDNVQAIHSSAVHFVRPEQLFYLQSRGIEPVQAKRMIVTGFLESLLARVHEPGMLEKITALIEERQTLIVE